LILHGGSDVDWAMSLAEELAEHAPVRLKLGRTPPKVTFGPSVVRVGLWSETCREDGVDETLVGLLQAEPGHAVLVRRDGAAPPVGLDVASLAAELSADEPGAAGEALRGAVPRVASNVAEALRDRRDRATAEYTKRRRKADLGTLFVVAAILAGCAWLFNWFGLRG
jgi:hypothetical protein